MRYGVLADVHGNLHALQAALATLRRADADRLLCLGDLVGYGPFPNECVRLIAEVATLCVAGNHDLIAIGRMEDDRCGPLARDTMRWTRSVLDADAKRYLERLPLVARPDAAIVMTHGALGDPGRYVVTAGHAREELRRLEAEHDRATLLLLGHTHVSMACGERSGVRLARTAGRIGLTADERFVLNPGSVGQSRQLSARARVLVVDLDGGTATFLSTRYDIRATGRALRERGLAPGAHHLRPSVMRAVASRARRLAGTAARAR
jgi:predicted phosphodiesterase